MGGSDLRQRTYSSWVYFVHVLAQGWHRKRAALDDGGTLSPVGAGD